MCDYPCVCPVLEKSKSKLSLLLLDCWQREYDKRPYRHFKFERLKFEERLDRNYDLKEDFNIIVSFVTSRSLTCIKFVGFRITADDFSLITEFVKGLQRIKKLELKLMELPNEFFQLLVENVEHMCIKELSLEGTPLNDEDVYQLQTFIVNSKTLNKLNVSSCNLNQYNVAQIADAVYKSSCLCSFNMSHIFGLHLYLDSDKIAHVVSSLIWQNKLKELILENCGFIGHDMETISEFLYHTCSKLETLSVSYNKIGANGALKVLRAIASSATLKHLKMNGCSLKTHGGELVAQYLSCCWNLESLAIQNNNIGSAAINMILLCMKKSCKLKKLHFYGNLFDKDTGRILKRLMDSGVLPQDYIDVTITYDDTISAYRLIPSH